MPRLAIAVILSMLTFVPLARAAPPSHAKVSMAVNTSALRPGDDAVLAIVCEIADGFHAQSHTPAEGNLPFTVTVSPEARVDIGTVVYPKGVDETYSVLGKLNVYTGRVIVYVPIKLHADAAAGELKLNASAHFQICDDRKCFLPEKPALNLNVPIAATGSPVSANAPEIFAGYTAQKATTEPTTVPTTAPAAAALPPSGQPPVAPSSVRAAALSASQLLLAVGTALLTGILFNVMPCVLPVVPLKIMGFYEVSQHNRAKSVALGAVFSAGIVASFGVLALLVVVLRVINWGGLFQNTWFTLVMVGVLTAMAASSFGFFTVNLPGGVYRFSPRHDTYTGNFLFGILTAALSTPCTFGMFVGLLATALSQPASVGVLLIMAVGVGMALPYMILSAVPEVARNMPRAGPWAEVVKQMMAFMLLATAVYFAQPLFERFVYDTVFWWTMFAVVAAAGAFLIGRATQLSRTLRPRAIAVVVALAMVIPAFIGARRLTTRPYTWVSFSDTVLSDARTSHRPVLVDFTATWCGNCHWVEGFVLHDPRVIDAVRAHDVLMIKADVTDDNSPAKPLLAALSPAGAIPLTAVYSPAGTKPILLDGIYGVNDLLSAIDQAMRAR